MRNTLRVNFITRTSSVEFQDNSDLTETNNKQVGKRENKGHSQEEIKTFVKDQISENTTKTVSNIKTIENEDYFRSKDALVQLICAVRNNK